MQNICYISLLITSDGLSIAATMSIINCQRASQKKNTAPNESSQQITKQTFAAAVLCQSDDITCFPMEHYVFHTFLTQRRIIYMHQYIKT